MAHQNIFAGNPLDRAGDLRNDSEWLAEQEANPEAQSMVLWEGRPLVEETAEGPRLAWLSLKHARDMVPDRDVFLGLWAGAPVFAIEFEGSIDPAEGPVRGLGAFHEMRGAAAILPAQDAAMAGGAKSLFDWRRKHGFCANCGTLSETTSGGWKRRCPACGTEHFPRVDPVTIMLPVYKGGPEPICLLGRQAAWPVGRMSALAGFLEPGESIEEACAREVKEEAGLALPVATDDRPDRRGVGRPGPAGSDRAGIGGLADAGRGQGRDRRRTSDHPGPAALRHRPQPDQGLGGGRVGRLFPPPAGEGGREATGWGRQGKAAPI